MKKSKNEHKEILIDALGQVKYYLNRNGLCDIVYDLDLVIFYLYFDNFISDDEYECISQYVINCVRVNKLIDVNEGIYTRDTNNLIEWVNRQIEILSF